MDVSFSSSLTVERSPGVIQFTMRQVHKTSVWQQTIQSHIASSSKTMKMTMFLPRVSTPPSGPWDGAPYAEMVMSAKQDPMKVRKESSLSLAFSGFDAPFELFLSECDFINGSRKRVVRYTLNRPSHPI
jgi:hypothetical protein